MRHARAVAQWERLCLQYKVFLPLGAYFKTHYALSKKPGLWVNEDASREDDDKDELCFAFFFSSPFEVMVFMGFQLQLRTQ